ncbi:hypothetical protein BC628DRAFT_1414819 [Trametes gibbosa]|nr:hypothetical protein BC628DRAFT_1414819 [Trametes gibbosa]
MADVNSSEAPSAGLGETTPLLKVELKAHKGIQVKPMKYRDLPQAVKTTDKCMKDEPLTRYISFGDTGRFSRIRGAPGNGYLTRFYLWPVNLLATLDPETVEARFKAAAEKVKVMTRLALGDEVKNMYQIQVLVTDREIRRWGYASALVTTVTDMGDADGHDVWLLTSNAFGFYELLGFTTVGETTVGGDDPTYNQEPVVVRVMSRPARLTKETVCDGENADR